MKSCAGRRLSRSAMMVTLLIASQWFNDMAAKAGRAACKRSPIELWNGKWFIIKLEPKPA